MDATTTIIILILIGVALLLILYPLWRQTRVRAVGPEGRTLAEYETRYQASLAAIKDLMFDYEMGKVDEQDYKVLLANLKAEAAQLRRQIDDLNEGKVVTNPAIEAEIERLVNQIPNETLNANDNHALLAEIEADIERLKRMVPGVEPACANCGNAYEVGDAFCADCGQSLDGAEHPHDESKCAQCGYVLRPDDTFCAKCGTKTSSAALIAELGLRI